MAIMHVNNESFKEEVLNSKEVVLVDFFATWCGPCKMLGPVLEKLADEVDTVKFVKVDVDQEEDLAREYKVMTIPTLVVFKDGKEVKRSSGFMSKGELVDFLNIE